MASISYCACGYQGGTGCSCPAIVYVYATDVLDAALATAAAVIDEAIREKPPNAFDRREMRDFTRAHLATLAELHEARCRGTLARLPRRPAAHQRRARCDCLPQRLRGG